MMVTNFRRTLTSLAWIVTSLFVAQTNGFNRSRCAENANMTYWRAPNDTFLRDQCGKTTSDPSQAWGIGYGSCQILCGNSYTAQYYDWNYLAQGLTSWVLPWLALTAQLPFATKDIQSNFMALLLSIGSPSLITFSLALTILNSRSINKRFRQVKRAGESLDLPRLTKAVKAARVFLIESQQVPIQVYNGPQRQFAQLVVRPENWVWWQRLREEIQRTKRGWTYSLYAQVGWVCVTQILAIVQFFTSASLNPSIGIGLAINSLWIWMIPVILGWVYVGTQTFAGSIEDALARTEIPTLSDEKDLSGECIGIRDRTTFFDTYSLNGDDGYNEDHHREQRVTSAYDAISSLDKHGGGSQGECPQGGQESDLSNLHESQPDLHPLLPDHIGYPDLSKIDIEKQDATQPEHQKGLTSHPQFFLGLSLAGCELEPGPVFNFARVWSHTTAARHVGDGFAMLSRRQKAKQPVNGLTWVTDDWKRNLQGSPQDLSRYCSASHKDQFNLSIHGTSSGSVVLSCMSAAFMAVFLQWGSTGAAIIIAYRTPVVGLGCQSGSYLLYGVLSTTVWLTLFISASLSHHLSRLREEAKPPPHWTFMLLTVCTRLIGKFLAAGNAAFLVVTSIIQFTGLYDNCWCAACIPSLGRKAGWVILFASHAQIFAISKSAWIGGVSMSIFSALLATVYIFASRGDEIFKQNLQ